MFIVSFYNCCVKSVHNKIKLSDKIRFFSNDVTKPVQHKGKGGDLTDFQPSHFIVGTQTQIETHAWLYQKMLGHISILLLALLRCPPINSTLQSRYGLGVRHPETRQSTLNYLLNARWTFPKAVEGEHKVTLPVITRISAIKCQS